MSGSARGRYAPSPSGDLHLGNASTALIAWLSARGRGGSFVIRLEDLDVPRVRAGAAASILDDLAWLGLDWDEGPDRGGPHAPYEQSARRPAYTAAFDRLRAAGQVYPCFCSRRDIASAASAPQEPGDEVRYPGTCRDLTDADIAGRLAEGRKAAWRLRVPDGSGPGFTDRVLGVQRPERPGDFVVMRGDGVPAYQLAVVVDDAAMGITEVVRGNDLLVSTTRQILVQRMLALPEPEWTHVPLWHGGDGVRLSKRHAGTSLAELRAAGVTPGAVVALLAAGLGLRAEQAPLSPRDLLDDAWLEALRRAPRSVVLRELPS